MQEAESDAAIDATAKKNGDFEALSGHRAREIRLKIDIEQIAGRRGDGVGGNGAGGSGRLSMVYMEAEREDFGREER